MFRGLTARVSHLNVTQEAVGTTEGFEQERGTWLKCFREIPLRAGSRLGWRWEPLVTRDHTGGYCRISEARK